MSHGKNKKSISILKGLIVFFSVILILGLSVVIGRHLGFSTDSEALAWTLIDDGESWKVDLTAEGADADVELYADNGIPNKTYTITPLVYTAPTDYALPGTEVRMRCIASQNPPAGAGFQYFVSTIKYAPGTIDNESWEAGEWDTPLMTVAESGNTYLYLRFIADGAREYTMPTYACFAPETIYGDNITAANTIDGRGTYADVGEQIALSAEGGARIFYSLSGSMSFSLVTDVISKEYLTTNHESDTFVQGNTAPTILNVGANYIQNSGIWYETGDHVFEYSAPITVDESIYNLSTFTVYYAGVTDSLGFGNTGSTTFQLRLSQQVGSLMVSPSTIETTAAEGDPALISMGNVVTVGPRVTGEVCEIFYTIGQSSPIVSTDTVTHETIPGNTNTIKYDSSTGIIVSDDIADYGTSLYITVMGVCYDSAGHMIKSNSVPQTFVYTVTSLSAISPVKSTPETSSSEIAEVRAGEKVILYCETADVTIYYTTDGTEPTLDDDGNPVDAGQTLLYDNAKGIIVPAATDTLFTITAIAYRRDYATSDVARLTFRYPEAVSAPYATPASGTVTANTTVTLNTATDGAVIYYEVGYDGAVPKNPTTGSSVYTAENPIVITRQTVIKAMTSQNGITSSVRTFTYSLAGQLGVPVPSISSGAVVAKGTVITLSGSSGGNVYYTTDGSAPNDPANTKVMVGSTVILDGELGSVITLRTCSMGTNLSSSTVAAYSYTISSFEGGVFADVATDSTVKNGSLITLNTDVTGGVIYYTTDGTMPTVNSPSGSVVTVSGAAGEQFNLKAMAVSSGSTQNSGAATFSYRVMSQLKAVQSSVPDGACFLTSQVVTLTAEQGNIYYTTDGTLPTSSSTLYTAPIAVERAMTIQAIAVLDGYDNSEPVSFSYTFGEQVATPVANTESGEVAIGTELEFRCETEGAIIYYTTNGTDPDLSDLDYLYTYTGPIQINKAATYKVMAVKNRMVDSGILTVRYTVMEPVVIESEAVEEETTVDQESTGRLQSRRTFSDTSGPTYTDMVLKNATYGAVVSADFGVIPDDTQLIIEKIQASDTSRRLVKQRISEDYDIVVSYDITLESNGMETQPEGKIEIGLPIPAEYENSMIVIVHTQEDGTVEEYETRRSNGMAYAVVTHLSQYSIAAPVLQEDNENSLWLYLLIGAAAVGLLVTGTILVRRSRREKDW